MLTNYLLNSARYADDDLNSTDLSGFGLSSFTFAPIAPGADMRFNEAALGTLVFGGTSTSEDVASIDALPADAGTGGYASYTPSAGTSSSAPTVDWVSTQSSFVVNFDDLTGDGVTPPTGYMGLTWSSDFRYLDGPNAFLTYGTNGYTNGNTSPTKVGYNAFAGDVSFSAATDFDFNSAQITGAWNNGLNVNVQGWDDGVMVYDVDIIVDADAPYDAIFDFISVDEVRFSSSGGTPAGYAGSGTHFAIDDLVFNNTPGSIRGRLFLDNDLDGVRDPGEVWLQNRTIYIDANNNGDLDPGEMSTTTAANGYYAFNDLTPGQHVVRQVLNPWWAQTTPGFEGHVVDLGSGEISTGNHFGTMKVTGTYGAIAGNVYHDWNGNGNDDGTEGVMEGILVYVDQNDNGVYDPGEYHTYTDSNGDYVITAIEPGTYNVRIEVPTGTWEDWEQTEPVVTTGAGASASAAAEPSVGEIMALMRDVAANSTVPADMPAADLTKDHVEGQLIVKLNPLLAAESAAEIASLQASMGATVTMATKTLGIEVWKIDGMSLEDALEALNNNPLVQFAEPDYIVSVDYEPSADVIPNDPSFTSLYGMHNTGQTGGTPDADIDAPEAWDIHTGSSNVIVGVIDTGVDYTHPDLDDNMWMNMLEAGGTPGVDDDGNGYIDDIYGWDFYNNDSDPMDDNNHGTHVSGTIGAEGNNSVGVVGVNWDVSIMALKFLGAGGTGPISAAVAALEYATMMGADLTNNSWGGGGFSAAMSAAIDAAEAAGALFVAAAGNHGGDNDASPYYPATYSQDNVISVAATDDDDLLASFSGYGATTVDLAAPGVQILSTIVGGGYAAFNGTSMATPHVAGVAALIKALDPSIVGAASLADWKAAILDSVDPLAALSGVVLTGGRLNAHAALQLVDPAPAPGGIEVTITPGNVETGLDFGIAGGATPLIDTIEGTEAADTINALGGNDVVNGNGGNDVIYGASGNDNLSGNAGDDQLFGNVGDDILTGGAGADALNGGGGAGDIASYVDSPSGVAVALNGPGIGGDAQGDTLAQIEGIFGSAYDDILIGSSVDNVLNGLNGDDYILGLEGNDSLNGGRHEDTLNGGDGDDLLDGWLHDDELIGGRGADAFQFTGASGDDWIIDFIRTEGDKIWINANGASSFADLTIGDDGSGRALVSWTHNGATQSVVLNGWTPGQVKAGWFGFGVAPASASMSASAAEVLSAAESSTFAFSSGGSVYEPHGSIDGLFSSSGPSYASDAGGFRADSVGLDLWRGGQDHDYLDFRFDDHSDSAFII